jgi:hypothetical protein
VGLYNAIHVKLVDEPQKMIDKIEPILTKKRDNYWNPYHIYYHNPHSWIVISLSGMEDNDTIVCEDLSQTLQTAVLLLTVEHSSDSIRLVQYDKGKMVRHLGYGYYGPEQYTFDKVEGEPQEWEKMCFSQMTTSMIS